MRCFVGFVLFVVLYFGSLKVLSEGVAAMSLRSGQAYSQREAQRVGTAVAQKYHALVAVGAGVAALLACAVPTLLIKMSERDVDWQ
jgi:hypothetical protein